MARSTQHGQAWMEADQETLTVDAQSFADEGLCQVRVETDPPDVRLDFALEAGGGFTVRRLSHHGRRIQINYTIRYGLNSEAIDAGGESSRPGDSEAGAEKQAR